MDERKVWEDSSKYVRNTVLPLPPMHQIVAQNAETKHMWQCVDEFSPFIKANPEKEEAKFQMTDAIGVIMLALQFIQAWLRRQQQLGVQTVGTITTAAEPLVKALKWVRESKFCLLEQSLMLPSL